MYGMDDIDCEYQESVNQQDCELQYRIQDHILENKRLMEYIKYLENRNE